MRCDPRYGSRPQVWLADRPGAFARAAIWTTTFQNTIVLFVSSHCHSRPGRELNLPLRSASSAVFDLESTTLPIRRFAPSSILDGATDGSPPGGRCCFRRNTRIEMDLYFALRLAPPRCTSCHRSAAPGGAFARAACSGRAKSRPAWRIRRRAVLGSDRGCSFRISVRVDTGAPIPLKMVALPKPPWYVLASPHL